MSQLKNLKQSSTSNAFNEKSLQLALVKLNSLVNKLMSAAKGDQIDMTDLSAVTGKSIHKNPTQHHTRTITMIANEEL